MSIDLAGILADLQARATDLRAELDRIERAQAALQGLVDEGSLVDDGGRSRRQTKPARASPPARATAPVHMPRRPGQRPAAARPAARRDWGATGESLVAAVQQFVELQRAPISPAAIAVALKTSPGKIRPALKQLLKTGVLVARGMTLRRRVATPAVMARAADTEGD